MRLKSIVTGFVAGLIGCAAITPFQHVSAYDLPPGTTTITAATLYDMIGTSPACYYIGADNRWIKTTGSPYPSQVITGAGTTGLTSNIWNGRAIAWYKFSIPYEYATNTVVSPIGLLETNLHFSNVSYIDFGFVGHTSNKYLNLSVGTVRPYCYLDYYVGNSESILYGLGDTNSEHMASLQVAGFNPPNYNYLANFSKYEGSPSDFYYTSVSCACLRQYSGTNVLIGVPEIIINSDYVLEINGAPPSGGGGDSPVISGVGNVTGSASENSSGGYDINYDINIDLPDYTPYINPDWDADQKDRVDGARDNIDQYNSAEEGLLSEANDALSSVPDMEFDESLIEDAENPFTEFFGINIVGIMVFWVGAIAFISYILFGKWV